MRRQWAVHCCLLRDCKNTLKAFKQSTLELICSSWFLHSNDLYGDTNARSDTAGEQRVCRLGISKID